LKIALMLTSLFAASSLVVDWLQTLFIARNPDRFSETNVILGRHPSAAHVSWYFALCIVLVFLGSALAYWHGLYRIGIAVCVLLGGFELFIAWRNRQQGIRI
jgi:hypothetical protein